MLGFFVFTILFGYIIRRALPSPLHKITEGVMIIGVIIHELCHVVVCFLTNAKIESVSLVERFKIDRKAYDDRIRYQYNGHVNLDKERRLTFLQAFLIAFAPIYIGFWIFFCLLDIFLHVSLDMLSTILIVFVICSIILGVPPSVQDLKMIGVALKRDPLYSFYQIVLAFISVLILWGGIFFYNWDFFHEIVFYFVLGFVYYILRYSIKAISALYYKFKMGNQNIAHAKITRMPYRKRVKPSKKKERIKRCQW